MTNPSQSPDAPDTRPIGHPVERPLAATGQPREAPISAEASRFREATERPLRGLQYRAVPLSRPPQPSSTRSRVSQDQLDQLAVRLSDRDLAILRLISRHRYATTTHIRELFFVDHTSQSAATRATIRVLDRLLGLHLIARLERRVGGVARGSAASIWHLSAVGERLTRPNPHGPRRRLGEASLQFLAHALAVTQTHVDVAKASRARDVELRRVEVETEGWRSALSSAAATIVLQPDMAITLSTPEYDDHFYIEVDRGTESVPVVLAKCRVYEDYRTSGRAQAEHGVFPRVVWIVPTEHRAERVRAAIVDDPQLDLRVFAVITSDNLEKELFDD